jgi:uncharacterized protein YicC (UPF0701 family)
MAGAADLSIATALEE